MCEIGDASLAVEVATIGGGVELEGENRHNKVREEGPGVT